MKRRPAGPSAPTAARAQKGPLSSSSHLGLLSGHKQRTKDPPPDSATVHTTSSSNNSETHQRENKPWQRRLPACQAFRQTIHLGFLFPQNEIVPQVMIISLIRPKVEKPLGATTTINMPQENSVLTTTAGASPTRASNPASRDHAASKQALPLRCTHTRASPTLCAAAGRGSGWHLHLACQVRSPSLITTESAFLSFLLAVCAVPGRSPRPAPASPPAPHGPQHSPPCPAPARR